MGLLGEPILLAPLREDEEVKGFMSLTGVSGEGKPHEPGVGKPRPYISLAQPVILILCLGEC